MQTAQGAFYSSMCPRPGCTSYFYGAFKVLQVVYLLTDEMHGVIVVSVCLCVGVRSSSLYTVITLYQYLTALFYDTIRTKRNEQCFNYSILAHVGYVHNLTSKQYSFLFVKQTNKINFTENTKLKQF